MQFDLDFPRAYPVLDGSASFRSLPEDFFVDELLGFELSGAGEHLCLHIEKRQQNTVWVARQLAAWAGIRQMDVGYCGLKDRHAVTRQWFSLHIGQRELSVDTLPLAQCNILAVSRHSSKLRPGMHAGNAFAIRLRDVQGNHTLLTERWQSIARSGVPNYFGEQRFGRAGSNLQQAVSLLQSHPRIWRERRHQFVVSAARAWLFNRVLADRVQCGDWQAMAEGEPGNIPTAPLWGRGRLLSRGLLAEREQSLLAPYAALCEKLEHVGLQQERKPLALMPQNCTVSREGDDLLLGLSLPSGGYATSVLRELVLLHQTQPVGLD